MNNKKKNVSASCVHGNNSICFVAGRSGGHIKPALTLAKEYKETYPESTILFFSTHYELDKKIIQENNEVTVHIPLQLENVPRSLFGVPGYCIRLAWCIIKSLSLLHKYRPSEVISTGGYVSLPVCIAAKLLRIPITLYELNALPGKATRMLAPLAKTIFVPFKKALASFPIDKVQYRSYPLQFHESLTKDQNKARTALHLSNSKKTVFILGGSQGSVSLNNLVKQWIEYETSLATAIQIIHQTGSNDATPWQGLYAQKNITAYVFTF
ncbi:MAG: glycosyltransferase, partial [Candidatus Babeliales bacterium]